MADVENVIYAIERCTCHVPDACRDCLYDAGHPYNECIEMLLKDAMKLLKEQEPVKPNKWVPKRQTFTTVRGWYCSNCNFSISYGDRYCRNCGRKVKWDD